MDKSQRSKFRELANNAVIATFGPDSPEQQVALALEKCVDELDFIGDRCPVCMYCETHGDWEREEPWEQPDDWEDDDDKT